MVCPFFRPHLYSEQSCRNICHCTVPCAAYTSQALLSMCEYMWQGQRPPSRQKPPPEALHLFQPIHGPHTGGFAPSPVLRTAASLARPSTSASIMQQAGTATRSRPAPTLHSGRMTLADVQLLSNAAASTSQAIAAAGPVVDGRNSSARLPSARPVSARRL